MLAAAEATTAARHTSGGTSRPTVARPAATKQTATTAMSASPMVRTRAASRPAPETSQDRAMSNGHSVAPAAAEVAGWGTTNRA